MPCSASLVVSGLVAAQPIALLHFLTHTTVARPPFSRAPAPALPGAHRVPYNLCRNLEWQVCAATGRLPGQRADGSQIRFSYPPSKLPRATRPLGSCSGWRPTTKSDAPIGSRLESATGGVLGYANDDIFYLETCIFSTICSNRERLFSVKVGAHATEMHPCDVTTLLDVTPHGRR